MVERDALAQLRNGLLQIRAHFLRVLLGKAVYYAGLGLLRSNDVSNILYNLAAFLPNTVVYIGPVERVGVAIGLAELENADAVVGYALIGSGSEGKDRGAGKLGAEVA